MINEVFSDYFAQKDNFLTAIDARVKMLFIAVLILMIISSHKAIMPGIAAIISIGFLLSIRIPIKILLLRFAFPLMVATVVVVIQVFFYGTTPLMHWNVFGFSLVGYEEGLFRGFLIMSKVIGAVSLIIFLSLTTSLNKLFNAALWFKIPLICVEIAMLTFRYIFVLLGDAITIKDAQKIRLGYSSFSRSMRSIGFLVGSVVIQSYDQSKAVYESMLLRGYNGTMMNLSSYDRLSIKDVIAGVLFVFIIISLFILNKGV